MSRPEIYIENAIAMWASIDPVSEPIPGVIRVETSRSTRVLLRRPMPAGVIAELLDAEPAAKRVVLEDSFGPPGSAVLEDAAIFALPDSIAADAVLPHKVTVKKMPVMIRPAGPLTPISRPDIKVIQAADVAALAVANRVIAEGFPVESSDEVIPEHVLDLPEWQVWLAYRDGFPAAAGYTYDDGTAVGVYLLATLPEHRSAGLGRAIMTTAVAAHPARLAALVATDAGAPLYRSLGFAEVATSTWYTRSPVD
ncbi:MAG TPA: hypothetical protein DGG94_10845 [Micromonosporaceae bacterium]|nr:hypothetical protein [Micromonosporaceae bacterium]HCU50276.1 hypothetical protein [Micromonosporaceae bacterium]